MQRIFITGTAGFIGFHLAQHLLDEGCIVHGYDAMTDYYDVALKHARHDILAQNPSFTATQARVEDMDSLQKAVDACAPDVIVHLAGQAGVRYSIDAPRSYLEANIVGSFNVMEAARSAGVAHLLMASTSSVYGANTELPYAESHKADTQVSFYAATKKATESMGHAWANIHGLPITMFRFFTVYGPWGRPDMALFKFTRGILDGTPIDIYNNGDLARDFTYVDDLVRGIHLLMAAVPDHTAPRVEGDSLSQVAPFRVVNIGNSDKVRLMDFVEAIETALDKKAIRNYMPMQAGDMSTTWANSDLLRTLTGYAPRTDLRDGVAQFVEWYKGYYNVDAS